MPSWIIPTVTGIVGAFVGGLIGSTVLKKSLSSLVKNKEPECDPCEESGSKYYFCVLGVKAKGARSYTHLIHDIVGECPTNKEIETICQKVQAANPDFKECVVLSFNKVKD